MPRNPNSPHSHNCGPVHTHTSASENIKLQMTMAKLEDSLKDEFITVNYENGVFTVNYTIISTENPDFTREASCSVRVLNQE